VPFSLRCCTTRKYLLPLDPSGPYAWGMKLTMRGTRYAYSYPHAGWVSA
jgi:hypothetical protein